MSPPIRINTSGPRIQYRDEESRSNPRRAAGHEMNAEKKAESKARLDTAIDRTTSRTCSDAPSCDQFATLVANGSADVAGRLLDTCPRDSACSLVCELSDADVLKSLPADARTRAIERAVKLVDRGLVVGPDSESFTNKIIEIARQWNVKTSSHL
jgi:hypothetical protein